MAEPSESWLDWHFQTQLRTYTEEDVSAACMSDRVIMARWLEVLKAAPVSQKMARNSLMLLMHGHLEDFGFLRAPFTDVNNCNKDLNQVVNGYHGTSLLTPLKNARFKANEPENKGLQRRRTSYRPKRISSRSKLDPIAEVTEPSSAFSIEENVNEGETPKTPLMPASSSVRQKIQAIEKELAMNRTTPTPDYSTLRNTHQRRRNGAPSIGGVNRLSLDSHSESRKKLTPLPDRSTLSIRKSTHHSNCNNIDTSVPNQCPHSQPWKTVCNCPSVVQKLKDCFEEVSERLKDPVKDDNPALGRIRATGPPPRSSKKASQGRKFSSEEDLISKTRLHGGESIPISYRRDRTMMDLLRQQEEMRQQCLQYYNLDGTLKDELPTPAYVPASTIEGFSIGASRAMERMKRWRGKPNQLRFFRTIFRGCGLEPDVSGRVKALDRRFELVALQWLRRKRRRNPSFGTLDTMPPQSLKEVLEKQKAVKTEYMAHVAEIRKLCEILCRGVVLPDVVDQMFRCLDIEYEAANEAVEKFDNQLQGMFSSNC
ncbi:hypothetical protein KR032_006737 [Drosophila birchii]|nr:hypothetical protein KR032_006737 [Drosophila birchii]